MAGCSGQNAAEAALGSASIGPTRAVRLILHRGHAAPRYKAQINVTIHVSLRVLTF